ncbi:hypothetical protein [Coleofasciculus sp. F4-SAH-05]|uniref:hypothetical protein n=1 Tax=Coleofasciculus sp. F4-SAH-05 TaxID=3069525 RepID=UPI0032FB89CA
MQKSDFCYKSLHKRLVIGHWSLVIGHWSYSLPLRWCELLMGATEKIVVKPAPTQFPPASPAPSAP